MSSRFEDFISAGLYLRNWSKKTVRTYQQSLAKLPTEIPTKKILDAWVVTMRGSGLSAGACNVHIRSVNSYLSWLHEEGHTPERLRVRLLKAQQKQVTPLQPTDVRVLLAFRPRHRGQRQTLTLMLPLLDCGLRINEALTLERKHVDLDQLILVVTGKGDKQRAVPFSQEMRKHLFRQMQSGSGKYVFSTKKGRVLSYRNTVRSIQGLCKTAGVKAKIHAHLLRHTFAATFVKNGGDLFRLSRFLGHASISTTQIYLRGLGVADLSANHERITPLSV